MNGAAKQSTVFIVDDDKDMCDSIQWLVGSVDLHAETYSCAGEFLRACDPLREGCLLLDVRLPGMSGMELLEQLNACGIRLPVIILTGHGDVPMAVRALKNGAFDFIQKPFNGQQLLDQISAAFKLDSERRRQRSEMNILRAHYEALTAREGEIMEFVVSGDSSKTIGKKLGISPKTVDIHRANVMKKLNVHTVAELVQIRLALGEDLIVPTSGGNGQMLNQ
jgi:FixJ family two-component response regulator